MTVKQNPLDSAGIEPENLHMRQVYWQTKWNKIKPLGRGGQGDTFLVKSCSGEPKRAVLKLLRAHKAKDLKARGRMHLEVANLKLLRIAGAKVPQVLDGNTEQSEKSKVPLYFVMEFIEGNTLADVVTKGRSLPLEASFGIALDLCATLRVALKEGIVHRDIKPENIIVRSCNPTDVVMIDFGLSFNEDDTLNLTETEEAIDNKFLSLPERRGPGENRRDPRSDLTSVCAILYYCLTKCVPRNLRDSQGRAPHQWENYLRSKKIQAVAQRSDLDLLFSRGLSYEIDSRFQTIEELTSRLEHILKPGVSGISEDLDTVLTREMATIRRVDRKTQLSDYYQNVWTLQQAMTDHLNNEISNKLSKYRTFYVREHNNKTFEILNEQVQGGELFARRVFGIIANNHTFVVQIHYTVIAQGPECVIYREIKEGPLEEKGKPLDPMVTVLRYEGYSEPDKQVILKDINDAVARSITLLSQKIQNLSIRAGKVSAKIS